MQSMTGFARNDATSGTANWHWELRSVNGKSLDIRFRMPSGFDHLEARLKEAAAGKVQRGNIQAALQMDQVSGDLLPTLNEEAFDAALSLVRQASERAGLSMPGADAILAMKGVVEFAAPPVDEAAQAKLENAVVASFGEAVKSLTKARTSEGSAIAKVVLGQIESIAGLVEKVRTDPSRKPEAIRERLAANVASLMEADNRFDEQRLHQEAAMLATKADLQEEIDRLETHIIAARELLASKEAVGRRLDFLAQEFNRECNTICSKSNAPAVTAAGLEMKVVIDQFREQIQNLQ